MATALVIFIDLFPDASCIVFFCSLALLLFQLPLLLSGFASSGSAEKLFYLNHVEQEQSEAPAAMLGRCCVKNKTEFCSPESAVWDGEVRESGACLICSLWASLSASCQR